MSTSFANKLKLSKAARRLSLKMPACFAARVSVFFCVDGIVSVCCRNRTTILGRYPELTLDEMWKGIGRIQLNTALNSKNALPLGCESCSSEILAENSAGLLAKKYDLFVNSLEKNIQHDYPLTMEFEIGNICNLECVMCSGWKSSSIRKNREKLPPLPNPYDATFLEQLRPYIPKLVEAKFLGGEPFLNKMNFSIWKMIEEMNPKCEVCITTNGTILNDSIKKLLKNLNVHIVISTEAVRKVAYESLRKNGRFEIMKKNLDWFHSEGILNSISVCAITQNYKEIPSIVKFCDKKNIWVYFNDVFDPPNCSLANLSKSELDRIILFWEKSLVSMAPTDNARIFRDLIRQAKQFHANATNLVTVRK